MSTYRFQRFKKSNLLCFHSVTAAEVATNPEKTSFTPDEGDILHRGDNDCKICHRASWAPSAWNHMKFLRKSSVECVVLHPALAKCILCSHLYFELISINSTNV